MFFVSRRYKTAAIEDKVMGRHTSFKLTIEDHNELVQARRDAKKSKDYELSRRLRAVILLGTGQKKKIEVAEICEVGVTTVYDWQRKYRKHGLDGLREHYKPKKCRMTGTQQEELEELLVSGPEAAGHDTGVWTTALIGKEIKERYGIAYSISAVTKLLHRLGFSAQLPQVQLARADPKAQKKWQNKTYPAILRRARKERGRVFFSGTSASSNNRAQEPVPGPR